jgi:hypothetical protein
MMALTASDDIPQSRCNNRGEEHSRDESDIAEEAATPTTSGMSWIERRHYTSTAAMCLCTFTHSWLLVSVFPYSGFMVIKLVPGTDEENAGSYAGLLAASFMNRKGAHELWVGANRRHLRPSDRLFCLPGVIRHILGLVWTFVVFQDCLFVAIFAWS